MTTKIRKFLPNSILKLASVSVLLLVGFFFIHVSQAAASTLYFNAGADTNWNTRIGNWWNDSGFTAQAPSLPTVGDDVVISGNVATNSGAAASVNTMTVNGSSVVQIPVTVANGAVFNDNSSLDNVVITGNAEFHGTSFTNHSAEITGNAKFYDTSRNGSTNGGTAYVDGEASFYDSSYNIDVVVGDATFYDLSYNSFYGHLQGDAIFGDVTGSTLTVGDTFYLRNISGGLKNANGGNFTDFIFNGTWVEINIVGNVTFHGGVTWNGHTIVGNVIFYGAMGNRADITGDVIFNDSSVNVSNGIITGNVIFNDTSANAGTINGSSVFNSQSSGNHSHINGDAFFYDSSSSTSDTISGDACFATTASNHSAVVSGSTTVCDASLPDLSTTVLPVSHAATFQINVTSTGHETGSLSVQYGLTASYGHTTTLTLRSVEVVSVVATGLDCATVYHYKISGINSAGEFTLGDQSFQTQDCSFSSSNSQTKTWTTTADFNSNSVLDSTHVSHDQVTLSSDFYSSVSVGDDSTLAIKTDGTLWASGYNGYGQLGFGDTDDRHSLTQVGTDADWQSVLAGYDASYGIKTDGTLWAWGYNGYGELGLGDTDERDVPTQVGTDTHWQKISAGYESVLAIKTDGTLWAWGYNGYGELGLGDTDDRLEPTQVGTDTDWLSIAEGYDDSLAIKTDGTLWAWGYNAYGELGFGDTDDRDTPEQVGSDTNWASVDTRYDSTLALKTDGTLWGWGYNGYGQLGQGNTDDLPDITQIGTDNDWASFAVSGAGTHAIKTDGTLWAWGDNSYGQLGLGDTDEHNSPTKIGADTDWGSLAVSVGYYPYQFAAIKTDGGLWIWGYNGYGELGLGDTVDRTSPTSLSVYPSIGTLSGLTFDAGNNAAWDNLSWSSLILPSGTGIKFRVRTSNDNSSFSSWSSYFTEADLDDAGSADLSGIAQSRYLQIEATLTSSDTSATPTLLNATLNYRIVVGSGLPAGAFATPPASSVDFKINNGSTATNSQNVTLSFATSGDIQKIAVSNTSTFDGASQEPLVVTKSWNLCASSVCPAGTYTVYVKFYNSYGQSTLVSKSITLGTSNVVPPITEPSTGGSSSNGSLVNDHGTIYLLMNGVKIGFTTWSAFIGLGYDPKKVVVGDTSNIPQSTYVLSVSNQDHPWGSWLLIGSTVYYSDESGLIGVPTWDIFLSNGGTASQLIVANNADKALPKVLPLLSVKDDRVK